MEPPVPPLLFALVLFLGMLLLLEVGNRLGIKRRSKEAEGERSNLGAIEGAVFALFGLMMAFTFSGAASRFNEKRQLIAEEANDIGTAYLRLDLVPEAEPKLQAETGACAHVHALDCARRRGVIAADSRKRFALARSPDSFRSRITRARFHHRHGGRRLGHGPLW